MGIWFSRRFSYGCSSQKREKIIAASGYNNLCDVTQGLYEIGYWCDIDYQGKGYVTECANALTRYAFDALGASKVVISMYVENKKSIAVAKRLNFTHEGVKVRDPLDCLSKKPEINDIYAANYSHPICHPPSRKEPLET